MSVINNSDAGTFQDMNVPKLTGHSSSNKQWSIFRFLLIMHEAMIILVDAPLLLCTHILLWKTFEKFQNGGLCYLQEMNTLCLFGLVDVRPCRRESYLKFNGLTDFSPAAKGMESEMSHSAGHVSSTPGQCLCWIPRSLLSLPTPFPVSSLLLSLLLLMTSWLQYKQCYCYLSGPLSYFILSLRFCRLLAANRYKNSPLV